MKRYWKLITLCLVAVIVIGAFYIQSSLAAENIIIEFEKVSGNEKEVEDLVLDAEYIVGDVHQSLSITNKETINLSNRTLMQQFTGVNTVAAYNQLIDKYKQFMRGKNLLRNNFYEDESLLAYISVEGKGIDVSSFHSYFDIEVLDKKSEETISMELVIPKKENYSWVDVVDIQFVDGNFKVIARGSLKNGGEELIVYTIDTENQKIVNDEIIHSVPTVENGWTEIRILNDYFSTQPEKYILFRVESYEHVEGDGEANIVADDANVYDIENNQVKKLVIDEETTGFSSDSYSVFESTLYIPSQTSNGLEVIQYDIEAEKWGKKQAYDVDFSENSEDIPYMKLLNGKIYIISSTSEGQTLFIGDLKTGESLFEGKLKVKNQKADRTDYSLYIHEIESVQ